MNLSRLIDRLENDLDGDSVTVREIVAALGARAFGPMFVILALIAILPTGAIPGVGAITGLLMALVAIQLVFGADAIWIPEWLARRTMGRRRFEASLAKVRGPARRIDRFIAPRLEWAVRGPMARVAGVVAFALALLMFPLILVPFGAFPSSVPILLMGLGLAARDGLLILAALAGSVVAAIVAASLVPGL